MTSRVFEIEDKIAHERRLVFEVSDMLHFQAIICHHDTWNEIQLTG